MTRANPFPFFAKPPAVYSPGYFADVLRAFSTYIQQMNTPGEGRHTILVLTAIPSDDSGLEVGTLFAVDGVVRVALVDRAYARGLSLTMALGTVVVTP